MRYILQSDFHSDELIQQPNLIIFKKTANLNIMLKFISLASGSSGNCYYLDCDGYGLIIDLGIGIRTFRRHCSDYGIKLADIKAVLVTHDHTDHVKAVGVLAQSFHIPVYTSQKVHQSMMLNHYISKKVPVELQRIIHRGSSFNIGPFHITSFRVPHDSADNNGYIIEAEKKCFVIMTDIGHFTEEMPDIVRRATHLIIESNYDEKMLVTGPYPARLQKRISGELGHISNKETAEFLATNLNRELIKRVWLCHLSAENNIPHVALGTVTEALKTAGFELKLDTQFKVSVLARRTPSIMETL